MIALAILTGRQWPFVAWKFRSFEVVRFKLSLTVTCLIRTLSESYVGKIETTASNRKKPGGRLIEICGR